MTPEQLRDHLYGKWDVRGSLRRRAIRDAEDQAIEAACAKYRRHTVDIRQPPPQYVEDELLAFERGWRRAKYAWLFVGVLVVAYVVIRVWAGGGR